MNKKLNLFLINNKINNDNIKNKLNFNLLSTLHTYNSSDYKALYNLLSCIKLLTSLKKTMFIYNNNYIFIIYNKGVKYISSYKFNNVELSYIYKLYMSSRSNIFINTTNSYIKFKSEHEKFISVMIDCYHNNLSRNKISFLNIKLLILCLYILL